MSSKRTKTLQVRLTPAEYQQLEQIAANVGLPVSTFVRSSLMFAIQSIEAEKN